MTFRAPERSTHNPLTALYPATGALGAGLLGLLLKNFRPAPNSRPVIPLLFVCQTSFHSLTLASIQGTKLCTTSSLTSAARRCVSSADNFDPYSFRREGFVPDAGESPSSSRDAAARGESVREDSAEA